MNGYSYYMTFLPKVTSVSILSQIKFLPVWHVHDSQLTELIIGVLGLANLASNGTFGEGGSSEATIWDMDMTLVWIILRELIE